MSPSAGHPTSHLEFPSLIFITTVILVSSSCVTFQNHAGSCVETVNIVMFCITLLKLCTYKEELCVNAAITIAYLKSLRTISFVYMCHICTLHSKHRRMYIKRFDTSLLSAQNKLHSMSFCWSIHCLRYCHSFPSFNRFNCMDSGPWEPALASSSLCAC